MSVRVTIDTVILRFVSVRAGFCVVSCGCVSSVSARPDTDDTQPHDTKQNLAQTDTNRKMTPSQHEPTRNILVISVPP